MKEIIIIIIITTDRPAACYELDERNGGEKEERKERRRTRRRRRSEWQLIKSPRKGEGMRDGGEHEMDLLSIEEQRVLGLLFVFVSVSDRSISPSRTTEWMAPGSMKIAVLSSRQHAAQLAAHCVSGPKEKWESRGRRTTKVSSKQDERRRKGRNLYYYSVTLVDVSSF